MRKRFLIATTFGSAEEQEKMEALVKDLENKCSVPEIGFGLGTKSLKNSRNYSKITIVISIVFSLH